MQLPTGIRPRLQIMMDERAIRKALRWDVAAAKRRLREETSISVFAMALWIEVHRYRPRQRLIKWLCERIPTIPLPKR